MRATEVRLIKEALGAAGGNRRRAAELLKIDYKALLYRIKKLRCEIDLRKPGS
jgi:transcriptional regulator with PAS, ATPase and Fis domain